VSKIIKINWYCNCKG